MITDPNKILRCVLEDLYDCKIWDVSLDIADAKTRENLTERLNDIIWICLKSNVRTNYKNQNESEQLKKAKENMLALTKLNN